MRTSASKCDVISAPFVLLHVFQNFRQGFIADSITLNNCRKLHEFVNSFFRRLDAEYSHMDYIPKMALNTFYAREDYQNHTRRNAYLKEAKCI